MKKFVLFVIISSLLMGSVFAGVEWTSTITIEGSKRKQANNKIVSHIAAEKGNLKQTFKSVTNQGPFYSQDGYWLYKAKSDMIYIVDNEKKTYMPLSLDGLLQMTGMFGQMVKIQIKDHNIKTEVLGDETICGLPCNHVKVTTEYTMKVKIVFIKKTMKIHEVKEVWATHKMPGMDEINATYKEKDIRTGIEDLDEMIRKNMEQQKKLGFPLKVVTRNIQKNKKGKAKGETITTMEVTEIKTKSFPKSYFEIPADYEEQAAPTAGGKPKLF